MSYPFEKAARAPDHDEDDDDDDVMMMMAIDFYLFFARRTVLAKVAVAMDDSIGGSYECRHSPRSTPGKR